MISATDLKTLFDQRQTSVPEVTPTDYDIEHLDYRYVSNCNDMKELEHFSGKEGYYPQLEDAIEDRLELLNPKYIRRRKKPIPVEEKESANALMEEWLSDLKSKDDELKKESALKKKAIKTELKKGAVKNTVSQSIQPTASQSIQPIVNDTASQSIQNQSQRIKSGDYRSWDRFNVDAELEKLDKEDKPAPTAVIASAAHLPSTDIEIRSELSLNEKQVLADNEKIKGNDAFRAGDYEEALSYYTRSLKIVETPIVYNNRAQTHLKLKNNELVELDATAALKLSQNDKKVQLKAYLRRAHSYYNRAFYSKALQDLANALEIDPQSAEAKKLSVEATKKLNDVGDGNAKAPRKMKIIDVDNEEEEPVVMQVAPAAEPSPPVALAPLVIQEVDEDEPELPSSTFIATEPTPILSAETNHVPSIAPSIKIDHSKRKAKSSAEFESILKGFKRSHSQESDIQSHFKLYSADQLSQYLSKCIDQTLLEDAILILSRMASAPQNQDWLFNLFESLSRDPKMRLNMKMFDESTIQGVQSAIQQLKHAGKVLSYGF